MQVDTLDIDILRGVQKTQRTIINDPLAAVVKPKTPGRMFTRRDASKGGVRHKLTFTQYLELLFSRNEIEAMKGSPLTNPQLEANIQEEFPQIVRSRRNDSKKTIGSYRTDYNKGRLFANQATPILVGFRYDDQGFVVQSAYANRYMTHAECVEKCIEFQIADPRFFSKPDIITLGRARIEKPDEFGNWVIPSHEEVKKLETTIGKPLYNSMRFPTGYGVQETLADV